MTRDPRDLLELFGADRGIVCAIGAGGKKSTLYRIAEAHDGPWALTATVFTTTFPEMLNLTAVVQDADSLAGAVLAAAAKHRRLGYARPSDKPGRYAGVDPDLIREIHHQAGLALTLVKADGARMRWLKAPKEGEPVLPAGCTTVIPVLSARALGEPLSPRTAHRPERVAAVAGVHEGDIVTPAHLARLLIADAGLLQGVGDQQVVPVINMVDDDAREALARQAAIAALEQSDRFDRVVLACMRRAGNPVVAVVGR
jgi:probable selenium-dependent hydroxylase accessory protein YqeC